MSSDWLDDAVGEVKQADLPTDRWTQRGDLIWRVPFPDLICNDIIDQVEHFWQDTTQTRMKELGFLHKRGFMMYGPPGCGKTCTIQIIIKQMIEENGIVIYSDMADQLSHWLPVLREVEPDRRIVVLLEDFDTLTQRDENGWLALLDGEHQVEGVEYLATTNYMERLDKRFIDRPSRFDLILEVPPISAASRRIYFEHKLPDLAESVLTEYVDMTDGLQIAHLRELIVSTECFGRTPTQAVAQLKTQMEQAEVFEEMISESKGRAAGRRVARLQRARQRVREGTEDLDVPEAEPAGAVPQAYGNSAAAGS